MKWLKKWTYLGLLAGMGLAYMTLMGGWQVCAEPLEKIQEFVQEVGSGGQVSPVGSGQVSTPDRSEQGQDTPDRSMLDQSVQSPNTQGIEVTQDPEETGRTQEEGLPADPEHQDGQEAPQGETGEGAGGVGIGGDPVYMTVEDDYFSDALFIGDSRTVGLYEYGGLEDITTFYASTGLTVYKVFEAEIVEVPGQRKKISVEEALKQNQFKKIYIMMGINEMGTGTVETFTERYQEVVDHLLELQPDAIVYIQGILKVTTERSNQGDYINNEGIVVRNDALAELADNERIFYLDANPLICDDTGGMEPSYTFDGVHLKAQYIDIWKDYLKEHAIKQGDEIENPGEESFM